MICCLLDSLKDVMSSYDFIDMTVLKYVSICEPGESGKGGDDGNDEGGREGCKTGTSEKVTNGAHEIRKSSPERANNLDVLVLSFSDFVTTKSSAPPLSETVGTTRVFRI